MKYEKLPTFCRACGKLGHWHQECGTGEHEEDTLQWGPFILAPRRGRGGAHGAGRGFGRGRDGSRGNERFSSRGGRGGPGRGDFNSNTNKENSNLDEFDSSISWRWNDLHKQPRPGTNEADYDYGHEETNEAMLAEDHPSARKRLEMDSDTLNNGSLSMVVAEKNSVLVIQPGVEPTGRVDPQTTPQKNNNKKKMKSNNGIAIDTKGTQEVESDMDVEETESELETIAKGDGTKNLPKDGALSPSSGSAGSMMESVREQ